MIGRVRAPTGSELYIVDTDVLPIFIYNGIGARHYAPFRCRGDHDHSTKKISLRTRLDRRRPLGMLSGYCSRREARILRHR